jgi:predicted transcriptional regulator
MPKVRPTTRSRGEADVLPNELVKIRKLLVYALLRTGASQKQIGAAIGVSQSSISRMFPDVATKTGGQSIDDNTVQSEGS